MTVLNFILLDARQASVVIGIWHLVGSISVALLELHNLCTLESEEETIWEKILAIVISAITVAINGLLVHGVMKNNRREVLPWLIVHGIFAASLAIVCVVVVGFCIYLGWLSFIILAVIVLLLCGIEIYSFKTVFDFHRSLVQPQAEVAYHTDPGVITGSPETLEPQKDMGGGGVVNSSWEQEQEQAYPNWD